MGGGVDVGGCGCGCDASIALAWYACGGWACWCIVVARVLNMGTSMDTARAWLWGRVSLCLVVCPFKCCAVALASIAWRWRGCVLVLILARWEWCVSGVGEGVLCILIDLGLAG